jgi:hypothetical protein
MSRYTNIVLSCLVFLIGLFVFRAIFAALGLTLLFLLATTLVEVAWKFRASKAFLSLANFLIAAILALVIYTLVYLPIEFLVTEIWLITPRVPSWVSLLFLVILVVPFIFVDWIRLLKFKWWRLVLVLVVVVGGFVYTEYRREKLVREYLPKIYRVDREWGIQAQIVKINGVNFFPVWKKGKVILNGEEMVIRSWGEELIIAEQSVPTKFGQVELYVVRSDGVVSNKVPFEIRDPKKLRN